MRKKGAILFALLVLFASVAVANDDGLVRYYMIGYLEGYNAADTSIGADHAANEYFGTTTPENRDYKTMFKNGYIEGRGDRRYNRPNKYTTPGSILFGSR
jgi:hypothetical protein